MKRWYQKILIQLSFTIALFIIVVEAILLAGSYYAKKKEYSQISAHVVERFNMNSTMAVVEPLDTFFVEEKLKNFIRNVTLMTLLIVLVVTIGTVSVFYYIVVRHLLYIRDMNEKTTAENIMFIPDHAIPGNEVGDIIVFRNRMLNNLVSTRQQLAQAVKMSALGEMAGGVAHEINTPLATIQLSAEHLKETLEGDYKGKEALFENLEIILQTIDRIAKIVSGLRSFARDSSKDVFVDAQVCKLVEDTVSLCKEKFHMHGVDLNVQDTKAKNNLLISCRPAEISQVILNLLMNAYDAVKNLPEKWVRIEVKDLESTVEIAIIDSGAGIAPQVQEKMMQPFFTTKEVGAGTGLGLSISSGIVKQHDGELFYDSQSKNTKFVLRFKKGNLNTASI